MAQQPKQPVNSSYGFFELSQTDIKDPTLRRVNDSFKALFGNLSRLFAPGNVSLSSTPTFNSALASGQTDPSKVQSNEFITKGTADSLYGGSTPTTSKSSAYGNYNPTLDTHGMTYAPIIKAAFAQQGNLVNIRVTLNGTASGSATQHITISLPTTVSNNNQCLACAIQDSGSGFLPGCAVLLAGAIEVTRVDGGNFNTGTILVRVGGSYQTD